MKQSTIKSLDELIDNVEKGKKEILIEENENLNMAFWLNATNMILNNRFEDHTNYILEQCKKDETYFTEEISQLCFGLYGSCMFEYAMKLNILDEVATIKDCGPKHFIFKTDWKQTVNRKKFVIALNRLLNNNDVQYLVKTIKYLMKADYSKYELPISLNEAKEEAKKALALHQKLVVKYNLDSNLNLNTVNPFDNF